MTHEFFLLHCPMVFPRPAYDDPIYESVKANPPEGCTPTELGDIFGLSCRRDSARLLDAVAKVCAEVKDAHGIELNDLAI